MIQQPQIQDRSPEARAPIQARMIEDQHYHDGRAKERTSIVVPILKLARTLSLLKTIFPVFDVEPCDVAFEKAASSPSPQKPLLDLFCLGN
jgi:hypothetical protein